MAKVGKKSSVKTKATTEKREQDLTLAHMKRSWALFPFIMNELFLRAKKGDKTARGIIDVAAERMRQAQFQAYLKRVL